MLGLRLNPAARAPLALLIARCFGFGETSTWAVSANFHVRNILKIDELAKAALDVVATRGRRWRWRRMRRDKKGILRVAVISPQVTDFVFLSVISSGAIGDVTSCETAAHE